MDGHLSREEGVHHLHLGGETSAISSRRIRCVRGSNTLLPVWNNDERPALSPGLLLLVYLSNYQLRGYPSRSAIPNKIGIIAPENGLLPELRESRTTFPDVACGLWYLHSEGVIHGDLRGVGSQAVTIFDG